MLIPPKKVSLVLFCVNKNKMSLCELPDLPELLELPEHSDLPVLPKLLE